MTQTVVVTGAGGGLGAAIARAFANADASVVAAGRDADDLETALGDEARVTTVRCDVRDEYDLERLMETAAREAGPIDVVVANAEVYHGPQGETPISRESYAAFDDTVRTNGRGVFGTIRESVPHLAADARVLVRSAAVAREAEPGYGTYAASKALAGAIARQFAADIDQVVGVVDPGLVGPSAAEGRTPETVAPLFVWAATEASAAALDGETLGFEAWESGAVQTE